MMIIEAVYSMQGDEGFTQGFHEAFGEVTFSQSENGKARVTYVDAKNNLQSLAFRKGDVIRLYNAEHKLVNLLEV